MFAKQIVAAERRRRVADAANAAWTGAAPNRPSLYVRAGAAALGALPTQQTVVAERFFDEGGGMQLVIHAPFGARINRAWGLALRKRFCRTFNFELQAAATDNGIVISLSEQHSFPLEIVFEFLNVGNRRGRADAGAARRADVHRALALECVARAGRAALSGGRKVPPPIQRMRSDDLLAAVFPDQAACAENLVGEIRIPDHPLVNETIRDCLHEAMDLDGLKTRSRCDRRRRDPDRGHRHGRAVAVLARDPERESVRLSRRAPLEERRARAVQMRRTLGSDAGEIGALDPAAIEEVQRVVAGRPRCRRTARCAADADRAAAGSGMARRSSMQLDKMRRVKVIERGRSTSSGSRRNARRSWTPKKDHSRPCAAGWNPPAR